MTKIIQLSAPVDNQDLGLSKGDDYYVVTHIDGVVGLKNATDSDDGLMSMSDKVNLDKLLEPQETIKMKSPDGSIFMVSVNNDGQLTARKDGS